MAQVDKQTRSELNAAEAARQLAILAAITAAAEAEPDEVQQARVESGTRMAAKMQRREAGRMTLAKYQAQLERHGTRMHIDAVQQVTRENLSAAMITSRARVDRAPRGHRSVRRASARSPGRLSEEPEPEPPRLCAGCGNEIRGRRKDARTCDATCRQAASRAARAVPDAWLDDALAIEEKALALVRAGELSGFDALTLVLWPSDRIRQAMQVTA